jgi:L-threonylcarbamoyladenylate synthase
MDWRIHEATRKLEAGGIIAYPTETQYGFGCDPFNADAVFRLLALKQRPVHNGLILIAADFSQLEPLLLQLKPDIRKRTIQAQAKPITWVLPCLPEIPVWLRGRFDTLAVRITRHPLAVKLCREWGGPLVSTSANIHGRPPLRNLLTARRRFNGQLDYLFQDSLNCNAMASEIRDGITNRILRKG